MRTQGQSSAWALMVIPILTVAVAHWPALGGDFIRDDFPYVVRNPHANEPGALRAIFTSPFSPEQELGLYRPITTLSFRWDAILSHIFLGDAPHPLIGHVTNLVLASLAACLVLSLARRLGAKPWLATSAATLFAIHAGRTEAVCWISGRAENLLTVSALAALDQALRPKGTLRNLLVPALSGLAFLSKEQAIVLPAVLALLPGLDRKDRARLFLTTSVLLGALIVARSCVLKSVGPEGAQQVLGEFGFGQRLLLGIGFLGGYVRLTLVPYPLLNEYDDPSGVRLSVDLMLGILFIVLLLKLALADWRRRALSPKNFGIALFVLPLVPVLNVLYRTGETFAERFLALPLAGALLFAASAFRRQTIVAAILFSIAAIHAPWTFLHARDWRDEGSLFESMVRQAPQAGSGHLLLASHWNSNDPSRAQERRDPILMTRILDAYERSLKLAPHLVTARLELAKHLRAIAEPTEAGGPLKLTALEEALRHVEAAVQRVPHLAEPYAIRGMIESRLGKLDLALSSFRSALNRDPRESRAALLLADVLKHVGRNEERQIVLEELLVATRKSARDRPFDFQPWQLMSQVLFRLGRGQESPRVLEEAMHRALAAPTLARLAIESNALMKSLGRPEAGARILMTTESRLRSRIGTLCPQGDLFVALSELATERGDQAGIREALENALRFARTAAHRERLSRSLAALAIPR